MKTVRVWFNHWFSAAYHIIQMLKDDTRFNFVAVGSNTDNNAVYRAVCDEWITEPKLADTDDYINFCLQFCRARGIDVFVPRRHITDISGRLEEFDAIGVKVLAERDYNLMRKLNDKAEAYKLFSDNRIGNIPDYRVAVRVEEFEKYYKELKTDTNRVCMKFASDEGAVSFRVIDDKIEYNLAENIGAKITYRDALKSLERRQPFQPLLMMPYLLGAEISADCLYMPDGGHIIIPRVKSWGRSERIRYDGDITRICEDILNNMSLRCPCNVQFKYDGDIPYLLEVNTRMSGGIHLSFAATGINIPNIAVNRLLGCEKEFARNSSEKTVSYIETPVVLSVNTNANLRIALRDSGVASRPYVVVNPLLAKHLPSLPSAALEHFAELSDKVKETCIGERVLVIGFAETATAVGAAVAASIDNAVYVHTTRENILSDALAAEFLEEHSHARNQALYLRKDFQGFGGFDRLIFVEDEITTGKTIINFLKKIDYRGKITVSALVFNGFDSSVFKGYNALFCCVQKIGYIDNLTFKNFPNPRLGVDAGEYARVCGELAEFIKRGVETKNKSVLVLGTEEFMYPAIIAGKALEPCAGSVKTHSTTRSPLLPKQEQNYPFQTRDSFPSAYEPERETYLYNLAVYDVVIVITDAQNNIDGLAWAIQRRGNHNIKIIRVGNAD